VSFQEPADSEELCEEALRCESPTVSFDIFCDAKS